MRGAERHRTVAWFAYDNAITLIESDGDPCAALMTDDEHRAMELTGELADLLGRMVGGGPSRQGDLNEIATDIHRLQYRVLAQAAGRAFPERYRTLGGTVRQ